MKKALFMMKALFISSIMATMSACDEKDNAIGYDSMTSKMLGVSTTDMILMPGETAKREANALYMYTVTYMSSDNEVATVDENGMVTAIKNGVATITVSSRNPESPTPLISYYKVRVENPLTLEAVTDGTVKIEYKGDLVLDNPIIYDIDGIRGKMTSTKEIELKPGQRLHLYSNNSSMATSSLNYLNISCTGECLVFGNAMSLINDNGGNYEDDKELSEKFNFFRLFAGATNLKTREDRPLLLPATTLTTACYQEMFKDCQQLTIAPKLPAKTLMVSSYQQMFYDCKALKRAPDLDAMTLGSNCYFEMFKGCESMTRGPEILPALTLAAECYNEMFKGCKSLVNAPELPAQNLRSMCYMSMFEDCESLTDVPASLPATTLKGYCYQAMFKNCKSLEKAPVLPANILEERCYKEMFYGCEKLNSIVCMATKITAVECTQNWVTGVAEDGTFNKEKTMTTWGRGDNAVPSNWILRNEN